jgi:hypothetical protein
MKVKNCFICLSTVLLLVASDSGVNVSATETTTVINNIQNVSIVPYAEVTEWHYQIVGGRLQKRLWSITYAKWLTEWEWV